MWSRKRLDIGWFDLLAGFGMCFSVRNRKQLQNEAEHLWSDAGDSLACLSVRSGFDLLLKTLNYPAGTEVLISALTIPDMVRILKEHQLVPVPLDLDAEHLAPTSEMIRDAVTPKTKAVVIAHLFGIRIPLESLIEEAHRHDLFFIEDCAQAYEGLDFTGHPLADVSMFSFGTIKTATALGGAMFQVTDQNILETMQQKQNAYPVQSRRNHVRRLTTAAVLKVFSAYYLFGLIVRIFRIFCIDYDRLFNTMVRGFPGPELFRRLRRQPCSALLLLLKRRLKRFDYFRLAQRTQKGNLLAKLLQSRVRCPTGNCVQNSHWVFPILSEDPKQTIRRLAQSGFDATQGQSMCVVDPPPQQPECESKFARKLLEQAVFLPLYPEESDDEFERLADVIVNDPFCRSERVADNQISYQGDTETR
jgi:perosamine synthetase